MGDETMRIVRQYGFGDEQVLKIETSPVPEPLPTEIRVRVLAAGVNPIDWKTRSGGGMADVQGEFPLTVGWDVAGVVDAVGFGVTSFKVGDKVYGMPWFPRPAKAYAEYVTAPSRQFAYQPTSLTRTAAAAVPLAGLTAWQSLVDTAQIVSGDKVLIHAAAGGVGHLAVQIAAHLGATVFATASGKDAQFVKGLGADKVIDYRTERFEELLEDLDVVIDLVGDADTGARSVSVLKPGGLYVAVPEGVPEEARRAADEKSVRTNPFLVEPDGGSLRALSRLIDEGEIKVKQEKVFPFSDVAEAHRLGESGKSRDKIVLEWES